MTSLCVIMPYMIWWGDLTLSDMILVSVASFVIFGISVHIAQKVLDHIHG